MTGLNMCQQRSHKDCFSIPPASLTGSCLVLCAVGSLFKAVKYIKEAFLLVCWGKLVSYLHCVTNDFSTLWRGFGVYSVPKSQILANNHHQPRSQNTNTKNTN